jgi:hypothetical protein
MFISSSNRIFSLTVLDVPARSVMPMVRQGLKCLARLPAEAWEMMGPVCTDKDFLSGEAATSMAALTSSAWNFEAFVSVEDASAAAAEAAKADSALAQEKKEKAAAEARPLPRPTSMPTDIVRTDGLLDAPNPSTMSTPAPVIPQGLNAALQQLIMRPMSTQDTDSAMRPSATSV